MYTDTFFHEIYIFLLLLVQIRNKPKARHTKTNNNNNEKKTPHSQTHTEARLRVSERKKARGKKGIPKRISTRENLNDEISTISHRKYAAKINANVKAHALGERERERATTSRIERKRDATIRLIEVHSVPSTRTKQTLTSFNRIKHQKQQQQQQQRLEQKSSTIL